MTLDIMALWPEIFIALLNSIPNNECRNANGRCVKCSAAADAAKLKMNGCQKQQRQRQHRRQQQRRQHLTEILAHPPIFQLKRRISFLNQTLLRQFAKQHFVKWR